MARLSSEEAVRQIREMEGTMEYMTTSYKLLSEAPTKPEQRLDSVESTIQSLVKSNEFLTSAVKFQESTQIDRPSTSNLPIQVPSIPLEQNRRENTLGYRNIGSMMTNGESLLKKVEMPVFDGSSPYSWIARAERFFRLGQHAAEEKLPMVSESLKGDALKWYKEELSRVEFTDWMEFKRRMVFRFANSTNPLISSKTEVQVTEFPIEKKLHMIPETIRKTEPIHVFVQEVESSCVVESNTSLQLTAVITNHKSHETTSTLVSDGVPQCQLVENHEASWNCSKESTDDLQSHSDVVFEALQSDIGFVVWKAPTVDKMQVLHANEVVEQWEKSIGVNRQPCAYHLFDKILLQRRETQQRKRKKISKSWKFKFKYSSEIRKLLQEKMICPATNATAVQENEINCFAVDFDGNSDQKSADVRRVRQHHMIQLLCTMMMHQATSFIFEYLLQGLWVSLPLTTATQRKDVHSTFCRIQNTGFHVCHCWKNKIGIVETVSGLGMHSEILVYEDKWSSSTVLEAVIHDRHRVTTTMYHSWRYKLLHQNIQLEMNLDGVMITITAATCWHYIDKRWFSTLTSPNSDWEQLKDNVTMVHFPSGNKLQETFIVLGYGDESQTHVKAYIPLTKRVFLLLHFKNNLLQVHQIQKQRKCSKTWMFKYKTNKRKVVEVLHISFQTPWIFCSLRENSYCSVSLEATAEDKRVLEAHNYSVDAPYFSLQLEDKLS